MKRRSFFILLAVFAALLIIALLQSQPSSSPSIPVLPTPAGLLGRELNMTVQDILAVRLRNPSTGAAFIISRDSTGNWTAPQSKGSLDLNAASTIAKAVVLMEYDTTTPITPSTNLQQYGFSPEGQLAVEILLQNNQSHAIAIGSLSPSGGAYYARVDDHPQIYLLLRGAVDFLLSTLNHPPLT